jgi:hypothetical protein
VPGASLGEPQLSALDLIGRRPRQLGFGPGPVVDAQGARRALGRPILMRRLIGEVLAQREGARRPIARRKDDRDRLGCPDREGQILRVLDVDIDPITAACPASDCLSSTRERSPSFPLARADALMDSGRRGRHFLTIAASS